MNTFERAESYIPELFAIREQIHRHPELGNHEYRTAELVEKTLHSLGIETQRVTETAIVGTLTGGRTGPVIALRADMDALPVSEDSGSSFASETPGVMHACGHDVHTTAALGAAMLLTEDRETLPGTVKFFFEPDEEGSGGAARMIAAGCMDGVEAVFGAHVAPDLPAGVIGVRYGKFYAASNMFTVTVHGRSAHGAQPEKGIDALAAAAVMITELRSLPAKYIKDPAILSIGMLHAGTAGNIIANKAEFSGIMRTLGPEDRAKLKNIFEKTIREISDSFGTTAEIRITESYAGIVNTEAETRHVQKTAEALFGPENVRVLEHPTMTTEDFGCFIDAAKGSFFHIGAGCSAPLHNPKFLPEPLTIVRLAALHADIIEQYLSDQCSVISAQQSDVR
ncbi:MAG: amidohydrolase [Flexilinea sp.]|nr:amidohydrolase [Flexilinea sp.]